MYMYAFGLPRMFGKIEQPCVTNQKMFFFKQCVSENQLTCTHGISEMLSCIYVIIKGSTKIQLPCILKNGQGKLKQTDIHTAQELIIFWGKQKNTSAAHFCPHNKIFNALFVSQQDFQCSFCFSLLHTFLFFEVLS